MPIGIPFFMGISLKRKFLDANPNAPLGPLPKNIFEGYFLNMKYKKKLSSLVINI